MPHRLEIALKPDLFDAEGEGIRQKAKYYFNIGKRQSIISISSLPVSAPFMW